MIESEKERKRDKQNLENLENEKSFSDEIKIGFYNFLKTIIW